MTTDEKAICVYGASSSHIDPEFKIAARRLGNLVAEAGYALVSGGGRGGLMAEAIEGANQRGGKTIGVLPQFMIDREWQHPQLTTVTVTPDMHTRKRTMASLATAVVAMPGGIGTLEELLEIVTWRQLALYHGTVVILNTNGYFDPLLSMLDRCAEMGFMRPGIDRLWFVAETPEEAMRLIVDNQTKATN